MKLLIAILIGVLSMGQAWAWCEQPKLNDNYVFIDGCLIDGLTRVLKDNKWAFVDKEGEFVFFCFAI